MRIVLSIFHDDLRSIVKHIFVLVVVLAVGTMPSLYAWINIYAGWDPYGSSGNVEVALASRDHGIDRTDGTHVDRAKEVIARVRGNTDIRYVPLDDPDEALKGVESGRYYAAIIFEDGFTDDIEHFDRAISDRQARITYYPNIKKNAVATKMTDAAAEELQKEVNREYLEKVLGRFFGDSKELSGSLDSDEAVDDALEQLIGARDALADYNTAISRYLSSSGDISKSLEDTRKHLDSGRSNGRSAAKKAVKAYDQAKKSADAVAREISSRTDRIGQTIDELARVVEELKNTPAGKERDRLVAKAEELADQLLVRLQELRALIPGEGSTPAEKLVASTLDLMIDEVEMIKANLDDPLKIDAIISQVAELDRINRQDLLPALKVMVADINNALKLVKPLLSSMDSTLGDLDPVLKSAGKTVSSLDRSLIQLQANLAPLQERLDEIIDQVQKADVEDRLAVLTDLLGADPGEYSAFFTDPVEVSTEKFYPAVSYGAAMAPFYTIIALWVGAVMLLTLMKAGVDRRKFPEATESQAFFGRYLILFLIGQMQAAVVVWGNILMLHVSPVHPLLMWFSASVTSAVFVLLIYAIILSFGTIGRGLVIIIMVLQVAGSSGSYPIELLPVIFSKIYRFFPFPSAINALRETMFGLYGADFLIYLGQLLLFVPVALAVGLLLRRPFAGVNRFMDEKLEETEVL